MRLRKGAGAVTDTICTRVTLVNQLGLHARAAAKLVRIASTFESEIRLRGEAREADAKSIVGVMMLAAPKGSELEIEASGDDARGAVDTLRALIDARFGEGE